MMCKHLVSGVRRCMEEMYVQKPNQENSGAAAVDGTDTVTGAETRCDLSPEHLPGVPHFL